ncbi:MAG: S41 family peptidase [Ruminococcus sp.]|nr:S41 family peptidase [Ruminococcus sp.]
MDNDTRHVLTILGLVACFGGGYFMYRGENRDILKTGEKLSAFTRVENELDGKANLDFKNENKAVENAVNAYYQTNDRFFNYTYYDDSADSAPESTQEKTYDYLNKYQMIDDIAYINCSHFNLYSTQGFAHFFRDNPETAGLIVDLRNNGGGNTEDYTNILGRFISARNIAQYHYNDGTTEDISTPELNFLYTQNVVILANEKTASASEIFIAAMKQFYDGKVTVIGTKTYGKGVFQTSRYLSDDELIKYTAGYYTVGNWDCYDGIGIAPDIELSMDYDPDIICTDDDIQLQAALDLFK